MYISRHMLQQLKHIQRLLDRLQPEGEPRAVVLQRAYEPREDIIVFTGAFNPPTIAHLALLKQGQRYAWQHEPMRVYAAFSKVTIDKEKLERPILLERIMLLQLILRKRLPEVGILLFNRGLYVEQAQAIRNTFPHVRRIIFLMGYDKIVQILDPRYYKDRDAALDELFHEATLLVAPRGADDESDLERLLQKPENVRFSPFIHGLPFDPQYRAISSTAVRQHNSSSAHDIPQEVRAFMRQTHVYAPPFTRPDGSAVDYYMQHIHQLNEMVSATP